MSTQLKPLGSHQAVSPASSAARQRLDAIFQSLEEINLREDIVDRELDRLDYGGSANVFRAKSKRTNKLVAVKCIRVYLLEDNSAAKALEREVRLWSELLHPNVLPLLGIFLEGPLAIPNLVSEWKANGTVMMYIRRRPFDVTELIHLTRGIASGLHYLHFEKNIIHADLKSPNILVSDDGTPLLADFGLSVSLASASLAGTTRHGGKGSIRWMAKELLLPDSVATHSAKTDIWAFGMVICELLTREPPFCETREWRVALVITGGELPDLEGSVSGRYACEDLQAFHSLCSIARSCWNEKSLERPSAKDVLDILEDLQEQINNTHSNRQGEGLGLNTVNGTELTSKYDLDLSAMSIKQRPKLAPLPSAFKRLMDVSESLKDLNLENDIYDRDSEIVDYNPFDEIFRARSRKHNKMVAIRRIRIPLSEVLTEFLIREVRIWSKLDHPNVLPLLGFYLEDENSITNLVSEWMEKGTLEKCYKEGSISSAKEICDMAIGIASGLNYLHKQKFLIHTDLKSGNIFISEDCQPLIADFGLSISQVSFSPAGTIPHGFKGSARWIAKELFVSNNTFFSEETDMWAFGMVVFELLSRDVPYADVRDNEVPLKTVMGYLPRKPEFRNTADHDICEGLWSICTDCWLDNPSERPTARNAHRRAQHLLKIAKEPPSAVDFQYSLLQVDEGTISTSEVFVVSKGTYLLQSVAVKKTRMPIMKEDPVDEFQFVQNEIQRWRIACDSDPREDYILKLTGFAIHEEHLIMVSSWKDHRDLLMYLAQENHHNSINHKLIVWRTVNGLKILHEQNPPVLHGNIRASNILVNDKGNPLLGGFGFSKSYEKLVGREIAEAHEVSSDSLRWLAPELQNEGYSDSDGSDSEKEEGGNLKSQVALYTTQSDVYSLGMTVFEIMTGEKPFKKEENPSTLRLMVRAGDRPKRPKKESSAVKNGLDGKLWDLLKRCWNRDPSARPDIFQINEELDEMWPEIKLSEEAPQAIVDTPVESSLDKPDEAPDEAPIDAAIEAPTGAPDATTVEASAEKTESST